MAAARDKQAAEAQAAEAQAAAGEVEVTFHGQRGVPAGTEFANLIVGERVLPWRQAVRMSQADADALREALKGQSYRVSYSDAPADEEDEN